MPWLLILFFCAALGVGTTAGYLVNRHAGTVGPRRTPPPPAETETFCGAEVELKRPACWLAVKGQSLMTVKAALGVSNPKPCPVADALRTEQRVFIAPPLRGWVIVIGSDLPEPAEDVDACFRFVLEASRKLGHVQFFSFNPVLQHHAWVRAEKGRIVRAYAWAGCTLWKQGRRTPAERELALTCLDYFCEPDLLQPGERDLLIANTEKVPLLASRWSVDPGSIEAGPYRAERGIIGEGIPKY
jgi:hypothetical protein